MFNIENIDDKRIVLGYIIVVLLSTWIYILLIFQNPRMGLNLFIVMMFFPAIVALLFGILQDRSIKSIFACLVIRPGLKSMMFGVGYPIVLVGSCGIFAILTGFGLF